jgi:hypothetical protein
MTNKLKALIILLAGIVALQSCGDDEKSPLADVLVTSHRQTGVFYKVDQTTGETTEIFTPTVSGGTLKEVRAFVYHPGKKLFYASATSETFDEELQSGFLYSINPKTKAATVINNNDGDAGAYEVWDAINNWAVAKDDSLVAIGDFNDDGNGIVKFGTDGSRSLKTKIVNICCGNGMLYDKETNILTVASSYNSGDGEIDIVTISSAGEITATTTITTFNDFPETDDLTTTWLTMKALAKNKDGVIYGILFPYDLKKSYLVTVDLETEEINYITTLGVDNENQYNSLAFIPGRFAE